MVRFEPQSTAGKGAFQKGLVLLLDLFAPGVYMYMADLIVPDVSGRTISRRLVNMKSVTRRRVDDFSTVCMPVWKQLISASFKHYSRFTR